MIDLDLSSAEQMLSQAGVGTDADEGPSPIDLEKHRSLGIAWIDTGPLGKTLILRFCTEPMRIRQIRFADSSGQKQCRLLELDRIMKLDLPAAALRETIPFYELISCDAEHQILTRVQWLLEQEALWEPVLPDDFKDLEHNSFAFSILACEGAFLKTISIKSKLCATAR